MNELAPIIFNEVKEAQKELSSLGAHVVNMSFPTEYPWEVFPSSRSWTVPEGGEYFIVCIGGGGGRGWSGGRCGGSPFKGCGMGGTSGSAGGYTNGTGGGGGGALAFARRELSKGATIVVTIGAEGGIGYNTNNQNGSAGGNSSVVGGGINISCAGGQGSLGGSSTTGAQSLAQAAGGDININGAPGGSGSTAGGGGGGGGFGVGGQWATGSAGATGGGGGGGGGGGKDAAPPGQSGQILSILSVIPGYVGAGSTYGGFVAIRRVR